MDTENYAKNFQIPENDTKSPLLAKILNDLKFEKIVDLGTGDGADLLQIIQSTHLKKLTLVELSSTRVLRIKDKIKSMKNDLGSKIEVITADVTKPIEGIDQGSQGLVICSQVIEHTLNQKELLEEMRRILAVGGIWYLGSVVKKAGGLYFYRNNSKFVLDPTHVHEFSSLNEFRDLINRSGLKVTEISISPVRYPLTEKIFPTLKSKRFFPTFFKDLRVRIPRFFIVEAIGSK
jgi:SAM-dependent methyltransferase